MIRPGDSFGDYAVMRLLGKGGMGSVFLLQAADGGCVAAKILDPEASGDADAIGLMRGKSDGSFIGRRRFCSLGARDKPAGFRVVLGPDLEKEQKAAEKGKTRRK